MVGNIYRAVMVGAALALVAPVAQAADSSACFFNGPNFDSVDFCSPAGIR